MIFEQDNVIIVDESVLKESYSPQDILHRDGQRQSLSECVQPLAHNRKPRNVFLYGPPGTGKTLITRWIMSELEKYASHVKCIYVNCWSRPTEYAILYEILLGMEVFVGQREPLTELVRRFELSVSKSKMKILVALDEVDQIENEKILYTLSRSDAGLIVISNNRYALMDIDERIKSSLSLDTIEFPEYSAQEIGDILRNRIRYALKPGAIKSDEIKLAARLSSGDARVAIEIIRNAALLAEKQNKATITHIEIKQSFEAARFLKRNKMESKLNDDEKSILEIIRKGVENPGEIYRRYSKATKTPVSERAMRKYLSKLVKLKLITADGDVRWRKYFPV